MPDFALSPTASPLEGYALVRGTRLYYREIGRGQPVVVLHGGPSFNHDYLVPEMDRLSRFFRLIYYDQRGRGKSEGGIQPEDVTLESEIRDLDDLREYFQLEKVAVLGHSWGGLLAMEYAIQHPDRVSHLVLMNTAPASYSDWTSFRQKREDTEADTLEKMKAIAETALFESGDLEVEADYFRIHFGATLRRLDLLEGLIRSLRSSYTPEGIRRARAIAGHLHEETSESSSFDLFSRLKELHTPSLVICGDYDFIPAECSEHIAEAIPGTQLVILGDCGHFTYLECPEQVETAVLDFFNQN